MIRIGNQRILLTTTISLLAATILIAPSAGQVITGPNATGTIDELIPGHTTLHSPGQVLFVADGTCTNNDSVIIGAKLSFVVEKFHVPSGVWVHVTAKSSELMLISPGQTINFEFISDQANLSTGSYRITAEINAWFVNLEGQTIYNPTLLKRRRELRRSFSHLQALASGLKILDVTEIFSERICHTKNEIYVSPS